MESGLGNDTEQVYPGRSLLRSGHSIDAGPYRRPVTGTSNVPGRVRFNVTRAQRPDKQLLNVLLVAQTPPPYGGQAAMMANVLAGRYPNVQIHHLRMAFSREMSEVGRFSLRKVAHLVGLIARVAWCRVRFHTTTLYYPPAGPDRVPILRDLILLIATRWMFRRVILHFQAGGLSDAYPRLGPLLRSLFRIAYFHADVGIRTAAVAPPDPEFLHAKREFLIPNAVPDMLGEPGRHLRKSDGLAPAILYVGVLRESKGVLVLIDACRQLHEAGYTFRLQLMGAFYSAQFEEQVRRAAGDACVDLEYLGVMIGPQKDSIFAGASVFCFPSFFESEAFPLAVIEAMVYSLPIVATDWRGIPAIVSDGENGFLVPIKNSGAVAVRLRQLLEDSALGQRLGAAGRRRYEEMYTLEAFHASIARVFGALQDAANGARAEH